MQQKPTPQEADPSQEVQDEPKAQGANKKKRPRHFKASLFLILFLLLVGGISYAITPLLLPYFSETPILQPDEVISVELPEITATEQITQNSSLDEIDLPSTEENLNEIEQADEAAIVPPEQLPKTEPEQKKSVLFIPQNQPATQEVPVTEKKQTQLQQKSSLLKAIQLYESFQRGGECRKLLEELMAISDIQAQKSLKELLPICLEHPLPQQMQQAFYKGKKRAILRILQSENTIIISYLKMLPYIVFDIYKKDPNTDTPMDVLYSIQNAVEQNQYTQVLELIDKLPENVQPVLYDLQQCALREVTIYKTLQNLIQTLAAQGGINE